MIADFSFIILLGYLVGSICLYLLLGGADFGAGIMEFYSRTVDRHQREKLPTTQAISAVWEVNHIWLIIAIVILFVGFPHGYADISIHLHIPVFLVLTGIVFRGAAFAFRSYDVEPTPFKEMAYSWCFALSSVLTPFWFGVIAVSLSQPVVIAEGADFFTAYVNPWLGWKQLFGGAFLIVVCAWISTSFLAIEIDDFQLMVRIKRWKTVFLLGSAILGMGIMTLHFDRLNLLPSALSALAMILAGLVTFRAQVGNPWVTRVVIGATVSTLVVAWASWQYPDFHRWQIAEGDGLRLIESAAPRAVRLALVGALTAGAVILFPALVWMFSVFKPTTAKSLGHKK
ncbi:MAG: cytochrome d ubiquinol oxidase subunit II [Verrucomicrobiales bacterium]|nr:cytochrome d ubiquinol oxidase subunit II [Verrucomicrobiales bacterium]